MSNKLHKLDCPFTQCCLITGVIYETARHMALSFLIIIIMREGKEKSTRREEGENVFYYRQKLLPSVINSRHFFQLLWCCWHDEWHRHSAQEHGHGIQGKEGNAGAHTGGGAGSGVQGLLATRHFTSQEVTATQTPPSPAFEPDSLSSLRCSRLFLRSLGPLYSPHAEPSWLPEGIPL